jgi:hypothetical protein
MGGAAGDCRRREAEGQKRRAGERAKLGVFYWERETSESRVRRTAGGTCAGGGGPQSQGMGKACLFESTEGSRGQQQRQEGGDGWGEERGRVGGPADRLSALTDLAEEEVTKRG